MGIRFLCPNGHKLNVKAYLAGERGICPQCDAKFLVPSESGGQVAAISEAIDPEEPSSEAATQPTVPTAAPNVGAGFQPAAEATPPAPVAPPPPPATSTAVAATPPQEAPAEVWYVRTAGGQQYGPANIDVMKSWVTEGRVTVDCWVWKTGWPDWKPGGQAITFLNVVPPDPKVTTPPAPTANLPAAPVAEAPTSNPPSNDSSSAEVPQPAPTETNAAPGALPEPSNPTALYQSNKRLRQERARKITLLLGVVVLILFAVLIAVLMNNQ